MSRTGQRRALEALGRAFGQETHNLTLPEIELPGFLVQQIFNRLGIGDRSDTPCVISEPSDTPDESPRPWLQRLSPDRESQASAGVLRVDTWVTGCVFALDGQVLVTTAFDPKVRTWDVPSGSRSFVLEGHEGALATCAVSPDGSRVVSAGEDRSLRVWSLRNVGECRVLSGHTNRVTSCEFSPDGRRIVSTGDDGTVRLWDPESSDCLAIHTCDGDDYQRLCGFLSDGQDVMYTTSGSIRIWNIDTSADTMAIDARPVGLNRLPGVDVLLFHETGWMLGGWRENKMLLRDIRSGDVIDSWEAGDWLGESPTGYAGHGTEARAACCAFSHDGALVAVGADSARLALWETRTGRFRGVLRGHTSSVTVCVFSPDDASIASASQDGTARLWSVAAASPDEQFETESRRRPISCVRFAPDGRGVVTSSADVFEYDGPDGRSVMISPGRHGSWNDSVQAWDESARRPEREIYGCPVLSLAFSPTGDYLALACDEWIAPEGESRPRLLADTDAVDCAFSAEGSVVAWIRRDGTLRIHDPVKTREVATVQTGIGAPRCCAIAPDGQAVVCAGSVRTSDSHGHVGYVGIIVLAQSADGSQIGRIELPWFSAVLSCDVSVDAAKLAAACQDGQIRLVDLARQQEVFSWPGHRGPATDCRFSADGQMLVSAGSDGVLRVWRLRDGELLAAYPADGTLASCDTCAEATFCCAGSSGLPEVARLREMSRADWDAAVASLVR